MGGSAPPKTPPAWSIYKGGLRMRFSHAALDVAENGDDRAATEAQAELVPTTLDTGSRRRFLSLRTTRRYISSRLSYGTVCPPSRPSVPGPCSPRSIGKVFFSSGRSAYQDPTDGSTIGTNRRWRRPSWPQQRGSEWSRTATWAPIRCLHHLPNCRNQSSRTSRSASCSGRRSRTGTSIRLITRCSSG